jgi:hypothetical protein
LNQEASLTLFTRVKKLDFPGSRSTLEPKLKLPPQVSFEKYEPWWTDFSLLFLLKSLYLAVCSIVLSDLSIIPFPTNIRDMADFIIPVNTLPEQQETHRLGGRIHAERHVSVICVGAGASGLLMAYKMQKHFTNYSLTVFEKNPALSGTWFENKYPGYDSFPSVQIRLLLTIQMRLRCSISQLHLEF